MIAEFGGEEFPLRVAIRPVIRRGKKMDPWRDFPSFTDGALDAFIKGFPSHPDHAAAVAEFERRHQERDQRVEARSDEAFPLGKGLTWVRNAAIAGITIIALAVLCLALPISTSRTQRARRPTAVPTSFPKPSSTDTPVPRPLPELSP